MLITCQLWWSPCPSRECPEEEEIDIIVDQCVDHCLLLEQNPKIDIIAPFTNSPPLPQSTLDNGDIDDLNFHLSKGKSSGSTTSSPLDSSTYHSAGYSSSTEPGSTSESSTTEG